MHPCGSGITSYITITVLTRHIRNCTYDKKYERIYPAVDETVSQSTTHISKT